MEKKTVRKSVSKDVIKGNEIFNDAIPKRKIHFGFGFRVGFLTFFFCLFLFLTIFLIITSISFQDQKFINYTEKSILDYSVKLKPNNYYDTDVLGKNMIYVASLIDTIDATFNYNFAIDEKVNMEFSYEVKAVLKITDEKEENLYLEKEYTLLENKVLDVKDQTRAVINETVQIDYDEYNRLATGFKSTYGLNSKSNLYVMLLIKKTNSDNVTTILNSNSIQQVKIPLSERSINIKLDYTDIDNKSIVISEQDVLIDSDVQLAIGVACLILTLYFAIKVVRMLEITQSKPNLFDKYVNKILKTYDRLIVESKNTINLDNYETIKVNRFEELLDVRDNLKLPINYYVITPHQKAIFYIISTNVYIYTVKEVDLQKH